MVYYRSAIPIYGDTMKTHKKQLLIIFFLFICKVTIAQQITGTVVDANKVPVEAALVWLVGEDTNNCLSQAITDEKGKFSISCIDKRVKLTVTCLGYSTYISEPFGAVSARQFPEIILQDDAQQLGDVVVVGERIRPVIEQKAGKIVFNVENSINAQGSNAYEVLKQTPGVTVNDGTKSFSINGRGSILVMLNGKQTYMQQSEIADLLKSTPSSNIKSIEVMSNATAQYDAAGSGGILNIILKKERKAGYNMTVNVGVSYWFKLKQNTELAFNYNKNKLNLYGNYSHTFGHVDMFYGTERKQSGKLFDAHSDDTDKRNIAATTLGMDYELNANNQIGIQASGNFLFGPGIIMTTNEVYDSYDKKNLLYSMYSVGEYQHQTANRYNLNANYKFELPDEYMFTFDFDYSWFRGNSRMAQPNTYFSPEGKVDSVLNYRSIGTRNINLYAAAANYKQKLWKGDLLAGVKFSNVSSRNGYNLFAVEDEEESVDLNASNDFNYLESILAGYLQYDFSLSDKWIFNAGCRIEYTHSDGHLLPLPGSSLIESKVKRDYVDVFPSFGVTYKLSDAQSVSFSYGKRIDRPAYSDLNPIDQPLDGLSSWRGNPFLEPQKTHRFALQYQYRNTSVELSYSRTDNYRVSITDTVGTDKVVMIPRNLGTQKYYGLSASQSFRFFHAWDISLSGRVFHLDNKMAFDEERFYHRNRWAGGFTVQTSFPLLWGIRSEILGVYSSKSLGGSTEITGNNGSVNIGFQKKFAGDNAIVKLSLSDAFWTSNWDNVNRFDGLEAVSYGHLESRLVKLNFTYKFGSSKKSHSKASYIESEMNRF